MIPQTEAFERFKIQVEELFDFVTTVCYAFPALRADISRVRKNPTQTLSRPDFYRHDKSSIDQIESRITDYESKLGKIALLSSFSYFESYVFGSIDELLDFHGGAPAFIEATDRDITRFLKCSSAKIQEHKRKLQEWRKTAKSLKYRDQTAALDSLGYKFPSALLGTYGVRALAQDRKRLKAYQIPTVLNEAFHVGLSAVQVEQFHAIREHRNDLAHGTSTTLNLRTAMKFNRQLRELAVKIDKHLVEHFFVIEAR